MQRSLKPVDFHRFFGREVDLQNPEFIPRHLGTTPWKRNWRYVVLTADVVVRSLHFQEPIAFLLQGLLALNDCWSNELSVGIHQNFLLLLCMHFFHFCECVYRPFDESRRYGYQKDKFFLPAGGLTSQ